MSMSNAKHNQVIAKKPNRINIILFSGSPCTINQGTIEGGLSGKSDAWRQMQQLRFTKATKFCGILFRRGEH